jgi:hypothetical protein
LSNSPTFLGALGRAYAASGEHRLARNMLKELEELSTHCYVSAYSHAIIHLALGDKNRTFEYLEKACNDRCEMMTWLKIDPTFDSIRTDPRFTTLLHRVGLGSLATKRHKLIGTN